MCVYLDDESVRPLTGVVVWLERFVVAVPSPRLSVIHHLTVAPRALTNVISTSGHSPDRLYMHNIMLHLESTTAQRWIGACPGNLACLSPAKPVVDGSLLSKKKPRRPPAGSRLLETM